MAAMRDTVGTLTIRPSRERENMARIEICARTVSPRAARTWFPCATGQFDGDGSHVVGVFECDLQGARQAVWGMSQNCPRRLRRKSLLAKRNSQQSNTFAVTRRPSPHPWAPVRQWVTFSVIDVGGPRAMQMGSACSTLAFACCGQGSPA